MFKNGPVCGCFLSIYFRILENKPSSDSSAQKVESIILTCEKTSRTLEILKNGSQQEDFHSCGADGSKFSAQVSLCAAFVIIVNHVLPIALEFALELIHSFFLLTWAFSEVLLTHVAKKKQDKLFEISERFGLNLLNRAIIAYQIKYSSQL